MLSPVPERMHSWSHLLLRATLWKSLLLPHPHFRGKENKKFEMFIFLFQNISSIHMHSVQVNLTIPGKKMCWDSDWNYTECQYEEPSNLDITELSIQENGVYLHLFRSHENNFSFIFLVKFTARYFIMFVAIDLLIIKFYGSIQLEMQNR